jgi:hypothetical protein
MKNATLQRQAAGPSLEREAGREGSAEGPSIQRAIPAAPCHTLTTHPLEYGRLDRIFDQKKSLPGVNPHLASNVPTTPEGLFNVSVRCVNFLSISVHENFGLPPPASRDNGGG